MKTDWNVLYRKKKTGTILSDTDTPFIVLKNSLRYWAADPFVFEENGETYIFAELFDKFKSKGNLGYCKYTGAGFTPWKSVIREKYHLSFPNIFKYNGDIFIMPESGGAKELYVYKAIEFPDKWEKHSTLVKGRKLADSVILTANNRHYIFTSEYVGSPFFKYVLIKGEICKNGTTKMEDNPISEDISISRSAGNFFEFNGKKIRVAQNCLYTYGDGLVFLQVNADFLNGSSNEYKEVIIKQIDKKDIKTTDGTIVYGTHTYNSNDEFEVIDIKTKQTKMSFLLSFPRVFFHKLKKILKKRI